MMVLEAIAKDIDPEINILKCAFPYFKYVEDFGVYTKWSITFQPLNTDHIHTFLHQKYKKI